MKLFKVDLWVHVAFLFVVLSCAISYACDSEQRSAAAKRHFAKAHPCPSTGVPKPSCAGYVIDHVKPLCAGGADTPENMQWQRLDDAAAKDRLEREECAALRRRGK